MQYPKVDCGRAPVSVHVAAFESETGVGEFDIVAQVHEYAAAEAQLQWLAEAYEAALDALGLGAGTTVLRRFFCSDLQNQKEALSKRAFSNPEQARSPFAASWVQQPPRPPARLALWACHVNPKSAPLHKDYRDNTLTLQRGDLHHSWTTGLVYPGADTSYGQTRGIFEQYNGVLEAGGMTLEDHVLRTWLYVRNVDANYQGMVAARREIFADHNLTPDTHFIASTGIEGGAREIGAKVAMDAYAVAGLRPGQVEYLAAPEHLSPTHVYGVTFERATAVSYGDRKHLFISGTASIDAEGRIVHPGDVARQLDRTVENMAALLEAGGASLQDMGAVIAYVRDPADQPAIETGLRQHFGNAPVVVLVAPVCRPGWLVELEGRAILPAGRPELPAF